MNNIICPITKAEIQDPVTCPDGHTYEREALTRWVSEHGKSPLVPSMRLRVDQIVPNYALRDINTPQPPTTDPVPLSIEYQSPEVIDYNEYDQQYVIVRNLPDGDRLPRDFVFVVDKSGSMDTDASTKIANAEDHGYTVWDVTRHAVVTALHSLCPQDRVAVVLFDNSAKVMTDLQDATDLTRNACVAELKRTRPGGGTNLHDGVVKALQLLEGRSDKRREPTILLFTDGKPTYRPPRGELEEFRQYVQKHEHVPTLHTFGFGNNLESDLLYNLAELGQGSYNFIPDVSFLGTIFVNAMANILSSYTNNNVLDNVHKLGPMQYGQWRYFVSPPGTISTSGSELTYEQCGETKQAESYCLSSISRQMLDDMFAHEAMLKCLRNCIKLCQNGDFRSAQNAVTDTMSELSNLRRHHENAPYIDGLIQDLLGEVTKAITQEYYPKWGKHWLYSLLRAHELQIRNNFLDPGVQNYGGEPYKRFVDQINDIFNGLPPPEPSRRHAHTVAVRSMSYYNDDSNPCFHGKCKVTLYGGAAKSVERIRKGDVVRAEDGSAAIVKCVLKTHCKYNRTRLVRMANNLLVTEYHPVKYRDVWVHPCTVSKIEEVECDAVYSFLLDGGHTMIINDHVVITLAHEHTEDILDHWYYGTQKVVDFLKTCPGWNEGLVELRSGCISSHDGEFKGLVYNM